MTADFQIAYAAHTGSCTFLLDGEGICRDVLFTGASRRREVTKNAARCVGAQYVASLDASTAGCLVELPRVGAPMLFARVDERGRVALVRTGAVTFFEHRRYESRRDPFDSVSVKTSAPELPPEVPRAPKTQRMFEPDYEAPSERTIRVQAVRAAPPIPSSDLGIEVEFDGGDFKTEEYASQPAPPSNRSPMSARGRELQAPPARGRHEGPLSTPSRPVTLRTPFRPEPVDDGDAYAAPARGVLPRKSERAVETVSAKRRSDPRTRTAAWQGEPKAASRRRER